MSNTRQPRTQPNAEQLARNMEFGYKFKRAFESKTYGAGRADSFPSHIDGIAFFTAEISDNGKYYRQHRIGTIKSLTAEQLQAICQILGTTPEEVRPSPVQHDQPEEGQPPQPKPKANAKPKREPKPKDEEPKA